MQQPFKNLNSIKTLTSQKLKFVKALGHSIKHFSQQDELMKKSGLVTYPAHASVFSREIDTNTIETGVVFTFVYIPTLVRPSFKSRHTVTLVPVYQVLTA